MLKRFFLKIEEADLEKRFFRYSSFYTAILGIIALIINIISNMGWVLCILSLCYTFFSSFCFYYSKSDDNYKISRNIFFIGLIFILDFSYFFNAGLDSSTPYAFLMTFLLINLVIKRKLFEQVFFYFLFVLNLLGMFYLEKIYPDFVKHYASLSDKESDLIGTFFMFSLLISVVINFFKSNYEKLLSDVDQKNKELIISEKISREERDKAEEANNAKKDFLSVMSHEIRTPLNAIISVINLLDEKKDEINNVEYIRTLKDSSENLLSLVSDILDFSKIESGEIKLEEQNFDLKKLLDSIINVYKIQAERRNNDLIFSSEGLNNFEFVGDSLRLSQVFNNLISNAIKFTENGIINLKISFIEDDPIKNTTKLLFEVTDTGIGIPEDKLDYIFEKFTQENFSITRKYGGSGLGLSITKKLIELMNGVIKLESEVGVGSRFYFYLDLEKADKIKKVDEKKELEDLSKIRVLLVEDNDVNIMLTTKFFDKWNLKYKVAENGFIAVDKFKENEFDVILMDLQMPEMDGFTATQEIRKLNQTVPIIALTANSMSEEREKCLSSGFNFYITKPFKHNYLKEKILFYSNLNK